ncbi:hypothetical protein PL899_09280, partial [Bifidobacterium adolescentis]|nr:hypothetical protein [Bifidobacterium adolescentis]MDB1408528.1 hypothetical protein [Bifidobacterium adolescentis]MDB1411976.1 hypothetical protein [Bifidobacterium adolescentis]
GMQKRRLKPPLDEMISLTDVEGGLWLKRLVPDRGFNQRITKPSVQYSPSDSFKPFAVASITVCSAGR